MALYHVHVFVIAKGQGEGGSAGFAQYIRREGAGDGQEYADAMARGGSAREDLVAKGEMSLPKWATNARHFFAIADQEERQRGTVGRCFEIALPRELSHEDRLALAADIRATYFEQFPSVWAVHNPVDRRGEHPHLHVMLSERREIDGFERGANTYFKQAAGPAQNVATHGVRKERSWQGPARLREFRAGISVLVNAALERAGHEVAVSHESLVARDSRRDPAIYTRKTDREQVEQQRQDLQRDYYPLENAMNLVAWQQQKAGEHIDDLSRSAIVDRVRDAFWINDRSPQREQERQASFERTLARQWQVSHEREPSAITQERGPARESFRGLRHHLWDHGHAVDDTMQHGVARPGVQDLEHTR